MNNSSNFQNFSKQSQIIRVYLRKKNILKKINKLLNHVNKYILELELKDKKIDLISKFMNDISILKNYTVEVQEIGLSLLEKRLSIMIQNSGFISIKETICNINLPEIFDWNIIILHYITKQLMRR